MTKFERDVAAAKQAAGLPENATMEDLQRHADQQFTSRVVELPSDPLRTRFLAISVVKDGEPTAIEARKQIGQHELAFSGVRENGTDYLITQYRTQLSKDIAHQLELAGYIKFERDGNDIVARLSVYAE